MEERNALPILLTLALAAQQPADLRALARFGDVPNVTITYYDVAGRDIAGIHKAIATAAPKDPVTHASLPATSSWTVGVAVKSETVANRCRITGVTLKFRGQAAMPRLLIGKDVPAPIIAAWNVYLARLEDRQAAQLRFAYERMGDVERAVLGSRCDRSEAAADAALAKLQEQQRAAFKADEKSQPKLEALKD